MKSAWKDECGIFGVYRHSEAANITYLGLCSLQHRGQESAGIASSDGEKLHLEVDMGLVADVFSEERLEKLVGTSAIGHNRYSTSGSSLLKNAQPLVLDYADGSIAVAHNGNLVNALQVRKELERARAVFRSTSDSEIIVQLIALSHAPSLVGRIREALECVSGAYSLLFLTDSALIAVRDPHAFRPLCLGSLGESLVVSSETCALDLIDADYTRDINAGELVLASKEGVQSVQLLPPGRLAHCIFEFIYFARPDSRIFGRSVNVVRKELGHQLAREHTIDADVVVPVPDSGVTAALGFAEASGIPFEMGLIRNHYVGRTFIEPSRSIRHFGVKVKLNPVREVIRGKRVIVIDDSIVRGTTSRKIVEMVRGAGAREVHMCISSPPIRFSCFYGIDTPTQNELIASRHSVEEINRFLTSDSLHYLSIEGLLQTVSPDEENYCTACFTEDYPIEPFADGVSQLPLFG